MLHFCMKWVQRAMFWRCIRDESSGLQSRVYINKMACEQLKQPSLVPCLATMPLDASVSTTLPHMRQLSHLVTDIGKMNDALVSTHQNLMECVTTDAQVLDDMQSCCFAPQVHNQYEIESKLAESDQRLANFQHMDTAEREIAYAALEWQYVQQNADFLVSQDAHDKALLQAAIENSRLVHIIAESKGIRPYSISANHAAILTFASHCTNR